MCGIAGFVGHGDEGDLARMTRALRHRGPDAEGLYVDAALGVHLGHRRLSILDHDGGDQPMWTTDRRLAVVFNGEIYNHEELRVQLEKRGHRFASDHSDTEVLLHGYREWGVDLVERLNGMWAFALFDRTQRRIVLSRDRFGQKPLFYAEPSPGQLVFASELGALTRHPRVEGSLSTLSLQKYFAHGYVPAPHSIYAGIRKLEAGSNLVFDLGHPRAHVARWWRFQLEPVEEGGSAHEHALDEALRERLGRAVARRMLADVPVGVFLSGGIDSSAIAAFAARERGQAIDTFSIGFDDPSFDERGPAEFAARWIGTRHHCTVFTRETLRNLAPELAGRLDEPIADPSLLPSYLLSRSAREHVKVALGGDGADELFAGYDPFRALALARAYSRIVPKPVHRALRLLATRLPVAHHNMSSSFRLNRTLAGLSQPEALWNASWMAPLQLREIAELLAMPVDAEAVYSEAIDCYERARAVSPVAHTLQFFTELYLQNDILAKVDRASMLCGLEVRSPFLDIELVDFVRRLPLRQKFHRGETKRILKRALAPLLPDEIRLRAKKGFGIPIGSWFRDDALPFGPQPVELPLDPSFLRRRQAAHRAGAADHRLYLYSDWLLREWLARRRVAD